MKRQRGIFFVAAIYLLAWLFTMQSAPSGLAGDVARTHESVYRGWAQITNVYVLVLFSPAPFVQRIEWTLHWKAERNFKSHGEVCCRAWVISLPGWARPVTEEPLWSTK